ncbi:MAG: hypothetical protein QM489_01760 [Candidatus Izemoplasma sp.]
MRIVELIKFIEFRKRSDIRFTIYYSGLITSVIFLLTILGSLSDDNPILSILSGLLFSAFLFAFIFGIIYGMKALVNGGIERERLSIETSGQVLDVMFEGDFGLLSISEEKIEYHTLIKSSYNKLISEVINETLYISIGKLKYSKLKQLKFGKIEKCHITLNQFETGIFRRFFFYNIDGSYDKILSILEGVNKFVPQQENN